jgi:hypothetical protein
MSWEEGGRGWRRRWRRKGVERDRVETDRVGEGEGGERGVETSLGGEKRKSCRRGYSIQGPARFFACYRETFPQLFPDGARLPSERGSVFG